MQTLEKHFSKIDELRTSFTKPQETPVVLFMGPYNTGKSTLLNKLIGQHISPVDVVPTTSAPISLSYGERFLARIYFRDREITVLTEQELIGILGRKRLPGKKITRVEVVLDDGLLRRMCLVDTPGIDAVNASPALPEQVYSAEHIVYLLHQRGVSEGDRAAIEQLVEHRGAGHISFWINCNLGQYDGSSLEESRRALREICGIEVEVNVIDTQNESHIKKFRLFLVERAAAATLGLVKKNITELDHRLPQTIHAALKEPGDAGFLIKFWEALEDSRHIVHGHRIVSTIPPVVQQVKKLASNEIVRPEQLSDRVRVTYQMTGQTPDPVIVRDSINSFIERLLDDPLLNSNILTRAALEALSGDLAAEQYLVTATGGFSSGKTTFFNALLGEPLLPAENRPTTFALTFLKHGPRKKATLYFAQQVTVPTHFKKDSQAVICRYELSALERWLTTPELAEEILLLKKSRNGTMSQISARETLQELERLKKTFARVRREFNTRRRPWKSLFKKIPAHQFSGIGLPDSITVHFRRAKKQELNLNSESGRKTLGEMAGTHLALRLDKIEIEHPAKLLRTATFVDTPGLDSVYRRHGEITRGLLPGSDCFLFFLNGKHILTRPDLNIIESIKQIIGNEYMRKVFFIVNFSDTLSPKELEKVRNYLHANLTEPEIYFISALEALAGKDLNGFSRLVLQMKERIWQSRCQDNYTRTTGRIREILQAAVLPPQSELNHNEEAPDNKISVSVAEMEKKLALLRERIHRLSSKEDFRGFRDGAQYVRKGFLGLARKTKTVTSCRDMVKDINSIWDPLQQTQPGLFAASPLCFEITSLENIIGDLSNGELITEEARNMLLTAVDDEENRLRRILETLAERLRKPPVPKPQHPVGTSLPLKQAVQVYLTELNNLEKNIKAPGGIY